MITWAYEAGGATHYGCPVEVFVPGRGYVRLVLQYGGADGDTVVDWRTGRRLCDVGGRHGAPQERARRAAAEYFEELRPRYATASEWHAAIAVFFDTHPILNTIPRVI